MSLELHTKYTISSNIVKNHTLDIDYIKTHLKLIKFEDRLKYFSRYELPILSSIFKESNLYVNTINKLIENFNDSEIIGLNLATQQYYFTDHMTLVQFNNGVGLTIDQDSLLKIILQPFDILEC